jgi:hypothetical protein
MTEEKLPFNDSGLKAAVRRLRGGHTAGPELVERVAAALATAPEGDAPAPGELVDAHGATVQGSDSRRVGPAGLWVRRLAVAASVILFAGAVATFVKVRHDRHEAEEYLEANEGLLRGMAAAHSGGMPSGPAVQPLSAAEGGAAVRDQAAKQLSRYVPVPDLSGSGWALASAAVAPFGSSATPAGRFEFIRDSRRLTLFSLPAAAFVGAEEGAVYETTVQGCPIAGFVSKGGIHCVVGDVGLRLPEIVNLRDRLRRS